MARADTSTLLPLDSYARIMGINPLHFNGARLPDLATSGEEPFTTSGAEGLSERPVWRQFTWQDTNNISRDMIAREIQRAEHDIAEFLGYWPAPKWISQEIHNYPRPYRPEAYGNGRNVRNQMKSIKLRMAKIIRPGRRNTTLIGTATIAGGTLVFSDPNTDGWNTLATITLPTTITDTCEIAVFFANEGASQAWQVRPLKSVAIAGGFVTITVDSWLLFDPDVTNAIPTGELIAINGSTAANYITSIEVYREFTDFTQPSAQFFWERDPKSLLPLFTCTSCSGTGCEACTLIAQNGCFQIRNVGSGEVVPIPATFDTDEEIWETVNWTECREPDQVKVWYQAGEQSENGLRGGCDKLDSVLARNIAILATSRLTCRFRAATNVADFVEYYRRDIAESGEGIPTIFTPPTILSNPFGSRRGEVEVWRNLSKMRKRVMRMGVAVA